MVDVLFFTPTMYKPTNEYREIKQDNVRIYGKDWYQPESKSNDMRHPFNILIEEIYG